MGEGSLRWGSQAKMTLKLKPEEVGVSHARSILDRGPSKRRGGDDFVFPRICVVGAS